MSSPLFGNLLSKINSSHLACCFIPVTRVRADVSVGVWHWNFIIKGLAGLWPLNGCQFFHKLVGLPLSLLCHASVWGFHQFAFASCSVSRFLIMTAVCHTSLTLIICCGFSECGFHCMQSLWGSHRVTPSLLLFNFLLYFIQFYGFYFPDINMEVPLAVNGFLRLLLCDTNITFSLDC